MLQDTIRAKDFEKAKEIINSGGNPFEGMQDYHITSIYDTLVREKAFDVIDALIENGAIDLDIYEYDSFNKTIFISIIKNLGTDEESIAYLNEFIPRVQSLNDELEGKSLLSLALENEVELEILKALVDNGCDVNFIDRSEGNLIHQIVKKYTRAYDKNLAYLQMLLEQGVDIHAANVGGKTPLHLAVEFHKNEYIKWLLENGADPNNTDKKGITPFFFAVGEAVDHDKYVLLRQFATPQFDIVNNDGETLFYEAIRMMSSINDTNLNLIKMLLEDGADLYQTSKYYQHEVTAVDAIAEKPADILKIVLDSGQLDIDWKDDAGNTILHKVCAHDSNHEEHKAKETYRKVKLLLAAGADVKAINSNEETAMMLASTDNLKSKTVELLLTNK